MSLPSDLLSTTNPPFSPFLPFVFASSPFPLFPPFCQLTLLPSFSLSSLATVKAGATFNDDSKSKMTGSWFLLREETSQKARERLSKDVYVTGGAWDMSKVRLSLSFSFIARKMTREAF
jgi:hypothetical protein